MNSFKTDVEDLKNIVAKWNVDFPIDLWWRKKYSIRFNSSEHREVSFLDMLFEFVETSLMKEALRKDEIEDLFENEYVSGNKNFLKAQLGTDEDYDNLSLDDF